MLADGSRLAKEYANGTQWRCGAKIIGKTAGLCTDTEENEGGPGRHDIDLKADDLRIERFNPHPLDWRAAHRPLEGKEEFRDGEQRKLTWRLLAACWSEE